jgi:hypothetical protein
MFVRNIPYSKLFEKGDALLSLLFSFGVKFSIRKLQEKACRTDTEWNTSAFFSGDINLFGET